MDNQHKKISGYRELTQEEIDQMNALKAVGAQLGLLIKNMKQDPDVDQRWLSIAETHLQQGIMAAVRSVAKPNGFW